MFLLLRDFSGDRVRLHICRRRTANDGSYRDLDLPTLFWSRCLASTGAVIIDPSVHGYICCLIISKSIVSRVPQCGIVTSQWCQATTWARFIVWVMVPLSRYFPGRTHKSNSISSKLLSVEYLKTIKYQRGSVAALECTYTFQITHYILRAHIGARLNQVLCYHWIIANHSVL